MIAQIKLGCPTWRLRQEYSLGGFDHERFASNSLPQLLRTSAADVGSGASVSPRLRNGGRSSPTAEIGFQAYRIDNATGTVVQMRAGNWASTSDPTPLPQGDYHLKYGFSSDGKGLWVYKIDDQTGHTWSWSGSAWAPVAEPK